MPPPPSKLHSKLLAIANNLQKVERILFDLHLLSLGRLATNVAGRIGKGDDTAEGTSGGEAAPPMRDADQDNNCVM